MMMDKYKATEILLRAKYKSEIYEFECGCGERHSFREQNCVCGEDYSLETLLSIEHSKPVLEKLFLKAGYIGKDLAKPLDGEFLSYMQNKYKKEDISNMPFYQVVLENGEKFLLYKYNLEYTIYNSKKVHQKAVLKGLDDLEQKIIFVTDPLDAIVLKDAIPEYNFVFPSQKKFEELEITGHQKEILHKERILFLNSQLTEKMQVNQDSKILEITGLFEELSENVDAIKKAIEDKFKEPTEGLINLGSVIYETLQGEINNYFTLTGLSAIDNALGGLRRGEVTLLYGRNSEGKSTIVSQIALNSIGLLKQNRGGKLKGSKVFLYSGEMSAKQVSFWLAEQLITDPRLYTIETDPYLPKLKSKRYSQKAINIVSEFLKDNFFLVDNALLAKGKNIFDLMENAYFQEGCELFIIDNAMMLTDDADRNASKVKNSKAITNFTLRNNVHTILVDHPNKNGQQNKEVSMFDVSGMAELVNIVSNVIFIMRYFKDDELEEVADAMTKLQKNRLFGTLASTKLVYNNSTRTFSEINCGEDEETKFFFKLGIEQEDEPTEKEESKVYNINFKEESKTDSIIENLF